MKKFYKSIHQKIYTQNIIRTKLQYEDEFGNSQDMKMVSSCVKYKLIHTRRFKSDSSFTHFEPFRKETPKCINNTRCIGANK